MSQKVIVIVLRVAKYDSKEADIRSAFRDSMFELHYMDGKRNDYMSALEKAREAGVKANCIVVKDTVITTMSSKEVARTVTRMVSSMTAEDVDICYLNRYMDQCQMMTDCASDTSTNGVKLSRTRSPYGDECILFNPDGRDMILGLETMRNGRKFRYRDSMSESLNRAIKTDGIDAIAASPSVFHFDIEGATDNNDFVKRCECAPVQLLPEAVDQGLSTTSFIFLIVAFFIILAVAWALIYVGPKY